MRLIADQRRKVPRFRGLYHAAVTILREEVTHFTRWWPATGVFYLNEWYFTTQWLTASRYGFIKLFTPPLAGCGRGVPRSGPHGDEAGLQPGHQVLRDGVAAEQVHRRGPGRGRPLLPGGSVRSYGRWSPADYLHSSMSIAYCYVAGGASVLGNTPIDVIKTRMQSGRFTSSWQCVKHLASNEGVRGFYKGCLPRLNRVCLEVALAFTIFDSVQNLFKKVWP